MNLSQIETNVDNLINNFNSTSFIYDFLLAYGTPNSVIQRLKKGLLNSSKIEGEIIIKQKLFFKVVSTDELNNIIPLIIKNKAILKNKIRFVIVTDYDKIIAIDIKTNEQFESKISELNNHVTFFLPLAGMEKYSTQKENEADVKAAVQMAKLFDEIKKTNPTKTADDVHNLNVFLSRMLFCFFAEDTDIFPSNLFTSSINNHTQQDGSDLKEYLQNLFHVLNTEKRPKETPTYLKAFPYVNGGLFKNEIPLPTFNFKIRKAIIDSGGENWASINPDIFGSMIQAVVTPDQRGNLGMHYTSVPNIMKVIRPLFLDELYEEFEAVKHNINGLNKLLGRIANIRIFDPACGSGNFLIIAYKELRYLEIKILLQLKSLQSNTTSGFEEKQPEIFAKAQLTFADSKPQAIQIEMFSRIELGHFYGIELDDFAHEVAKLSLWLAQHQMNVEFNKVIGSHNPSLPLRDAGVIIQGNATRLNWEIVCPKPKKGEVFILGNPPYLGTRRQSEEQTSDLKSVYGNIYKSVDYIGAWFYKGANYVRNSNSRIALVSTNSICQGEQVGLIWPNILTDNIEIYFAYKDFKWSNLAQGKAAVNVVIIGLRNIDSKPKYLYVNNFKINHNIISPYLVEGNPTYLYNRSKPLSDFPEMNFGNMPADGGKLLFTTDEKQIFIESEPSSKKWFKKLISADEFINGTERWCLWLERCSSIEIDTMPLVKQRVNELKEIREKSSRPQLASIPHLFAQITQPPNQNYILIPRHSSENRDYIPFGFFSSDNIAHDSCLIIPTNKTYIFGVLTSKIHMIWINAVCGRLERRYRYSKDIVYNNFPFPPILQVQKEILEQHTHNILEQRAIHKEKPFAELYNPDKMPEDLLNAHLALDFAVERCYRDKPFETDEERLAHLFKLYEQMILDEKNKGTLSLFENDSKPKKSKKK